MFLAENPGFFVSQPKSSAGPSKPRPGQRTPLSQKRVLSSERVAPEDSDSDSPSVTNPRVEIPVSRQRTDADEDDAASVELGFGDTRDSPTRSDSAESIDLSIDADRSFPAAKDESALEDSILGAGFNGRQRPQKSGGKEKPNPTPPTQLTSRSAPDDHQARRKRTREEDGPDTAAEDAQVKRFKRTVLRVAAEA